MCVIVACLFLSQYRSKVCGELGGLKMEIRIYAGRGKDAGAPRRRRVQSRM